MALGFVNMDLKPPLYFKSYYSCDLKSGQVWILNGQKEVGKHMVRICEGDLKWDLKSEQIATLLPINI